MPSNINTTIYVGELGKKHFIIRPWHCKFVQQFWQLMFMKSLFIMTVLTKAYYAHIHFRLSIMGTSRNRYSLCRREVAQCPRAWVTCRRTQVQFLTTPINVSQAEGDVKDPYMIWHFALLWPVGVVNDTDRKGPITRLSIRQLHVFMDTGGKDVCGVIRHRNQDMLVDLPSPIGFRRG